MKKMEVMPEPSLAQGETPAWATGWGLRIKLLRGAISSSAPIYLCTAHLRPPELRFRPLVKSESASWTFSRFAFCLDAKGDHR